MSATSPVGRGPDDRNRPTVVDHGRRLSTETKSAVKTTEFVAYIVVPPAS